MHKSVTYFPTFDLKHILLLGIPPMLSHFQKNMKSATNCKQKLCSHDNGELATRNAQPQNAQNLQTNPALAQTHSCLTHLPSFDLKEDHFTPRHSTHPKKHETVNKLQCRNCAAMITQFWQLEARCSNANAPLQNALKPSHIPCPSSHTRPCLTHFPTFDLRDIDSSPLYQSKTCSHTSTPRINQNHQHTSMQKLCRCVSFCSKTNAAPLQSAQNLHTLPALAYTHFPTFDLKHISLHATPPIRNLLTHSQKNIQIINKLGEGRGQVKYLRLVYFQACSASGFIHFGQVSVPSLLHLASYAFSPHMRSSCTNRASSSSQPQSRASHES